MKECGGQSGNLDRPHPVCAQRLSFRASSTTPAELESKAAGCKSSHRLGYALLECSNGSKACPRAARRMKPTMARERAPRTAAKEVAVTMTIQPVEAASLLCNDTRRLKRLLVRPQRKIGRNRIVRKRPTRKSLNLTFSNHFTAKSASSSVSRFPPMASCRPATLPHA